MTALQSKRLSIVAKIFCIFVLPCVIFLCVSNLSGAETELPIAEKVPWAPYEVIIPDKISWSIREVSEIYDIVDTKVVVNGEEQQNTETKDTRTKEIRIGGTSLEREHEAYFRSYGSLTAEAGVKWFFFIPVAYARIHAEAGVAGGYEYTRNRKYWEISEDTKEERFSDEEKIIKIDGQMVRREFKSHKLKIVINMMNNSGVDLKFSSNLGDSKISVYIGDIFLGNATLVDAGDCTILFREVNDEHRNVNDQVGRYTFELPIENTDTYRKFEENRGKQPIIVRLDKNDVPLKIVECSEGRDKPEYAIVQNSKEPFSVVIATPEGMRSFDIRNTSEELLTVERALQEINTHSRKLTGANITEHLHVHFGEGYDLSCERFYFSEDVTRQTNTKPKPIVKGEQSFFLLVDYEKRARKERANGTYEVVYESEILPSDCWKELMQRTPQPGDKIVFCVVNSDILTQYLPFNSPATTILNAYRTRFEQWEKEGIIPDGKYWRTNCCATEEEYFTLLKQYADSGDEEAIAKLSTLTLPTDTTSLELACKYVRTGGKICILPGIHHVEKTISFSEENKNIFIIGLNEEGKPLQNSSKPLATIVSKNGSVFDLSNGVTLQGLYLKNESNKLREATLLITGAGTVKWCCIGAEFGVATALKINGPKANPRVEYCEVRNLSTGFAVVNGATGEFIDCRACQNLGYGFYISGDKSDPKLQNCRIDQNVQAGIHVCKHASGTYEGCTLVGNVGRGIEVSDAGTNPYITGCKISSGKDCGICVCKGANGTYEKCDIYGNIGAGFFVTDVGTNLTINNSKFHDQIDRKDAGVGIYVANGACGVFIRCETYNNGAGIAVEHAGSSVTCEECNVHNEKRDGIWFNDNAHGLLKNCTAWENGFSGLATSGTGCGLTVEGGKYNKNRNHGIFISKGSWLGDKDVEARENGRRRKDIYRH